MQEFNSLNIRTWSMLGQRGTLGLVLTDLAEKDPLLTVLSADLGRTSGLSRFMENYPDRFINAGIAEQNMVGMAAGLAKEGRHVFMSTFANFLAMRSYEQMRLCLGYMQFPVKAVGIGSGFAMGMFGNSHYGMEDLTLMRAVPGLTVLSPADCTEVVKCLEAVLDYPKPVYLRLSGVMNQPMVYRKDYEFQIGKAILLREGSEIAVLATGTMVAESLKAAKILGESGKDVAVWNFHTVKPLDRDAVKKASTAAKLVVSVEEHSIQGGFGGAVAEVLSELPGSPRLLRIGIGDFFPHAGDYKYLLEQCGLTASAIARRIEDALNVQ